MFEQIEAIDTYNKNINILIGSGASADLFPTLELNLRDSGDSRETIETLATKFANQKDKCTALFMHYYNQCIHPAQTFSPEAVTNAEGIENLKQYEMFLTTLLALLDKRKDLYRKINIFTTNYDGCLALSADKLLMRKSHDFVVNDGTSGFRKKYLHPKNFNTFQCQSSIFEKAIYGTPQLNLIHLHGSVYWSKNDEHIEVDYSKKVSNILTPSISTKLEPFSAYLINGDGKTQDIPAIDFSDDERDEFWKAYKKLPIVNPTKWKFHETVFEEHYYQMLRLLSYELERSNSILITFGFSFADEHILKLIQRSLSNPQLQTFICCYSQSRTEELKDEFKQWKNVQVIGPPDGEKLNFINFNKYVFSIRPEKYVPIDVQGDL